MADDLTDEQVKAYRLADNKVGEVSEWDFDTLIAEMKGIEDIDLGDFGFLDTQEINWAEIEDLTEQTYEEPKESKLICPKCGHVAGKGFFKKA